MKPIQLATQVARRKESDSSEADLFELPEATRSSAPQKVTNFNICHKRDVLALVEIAAATGISRACDCAGTESCRLSKAEPLEFVGTTEG